MSSKKNLYLILIFIILNSCSSNIYNDFKDIVLTDNTFTVNDTLVKRNPVKLLLEPITPDNKFLGIPIGLYIYKLSSDNPDKNFDSWLNKKPKRYNRLSKILSEKQVNQLKKYNNSLNEFMPEAPP